MNNIIIRDIQQPDNPFLAKIVKDTLAEFGANHPNTVYYDPTTDTLFEMFQKKGAIYFVAELNNEIVGGGGIYPTDGLSEDTCELVKMYLLPHARGTGLGREIVQKCIDFIHNIMKIQKIRISGQAYLLDFYKSFGFVVTEGPYLEDKIPHYQMLLS